MNDQQLDKQVGEDGHIADVVGVVKLADGYGTHYISLQRKPNE